MKEIVLKIFYKDGSYKSNLDIKKAIMKVDGIVGLRTVEEK